MIAVLRPSLTRRSAATLLGVCLFGAATLARAEPTRELSVRGPKEVLDGDPESASVDAQGRISLGLAVADLAKGSDRAVVNMVAGPKGEIYAGTAGGGLLRIGAGGEVKVLDQAEGMVISALAVHAGKVYAATSPDGQVFTVNADGSLTPFARPGTKYIWALVGDGNDLLAATGDPGRILRLSPGGKSEAVLEPSETHVRALLRHPKRGIVAGGGQKGIVYQVTGKKAYALYDSEMEEVTSLAMDPASGNLYAAFVSETKAGALLPDRWIGPAKGDAADDDKSPLKGSEVVRITPSGHAEVLWSSKTEGALSLAWDGKAKRLYFSTGTGKKGRSRVYAVDEKDRDRLVLVARLEPQLATSVILGPSGGALLVGTAPAGRVVRLGPGLRSSAVYLSSEQDLQRISSIGRLWFDADVPAGAKVELSLRSGNTKEQDATWSEWSKPVSVADGGAVEVPRGRYVQLRATLAASPKGEAPVLKSIHASVVRMNVAPLVREVFLLRRGIYMASMPKEEEKEKTITLSRTSIRDLRNPTEQAEERLRVRQGSRPGMLTASWTADDPNRDALLYRVEVRKLDEPSLPWRVVADDLTDDYWSFDSRTYPDGRYQVRVTATDRPSNPPEEALTDQAESEPFLVDNGAPRITALEAKSSGAGRIEIRAAAEDAVSPLASAEISVNGSPWLMLPAKDGLIDAKSEAFELRLGPSAAPGTPKIGAGRHTVLMRVEDTAGNAATASATVQVP